VLQAGAFQERGVNINFFKCKEVRIQKKGVIAGDVASKEDMEVEGVFWPGTGYQKPGNERPKGEIDKRKRGRGRAEQ